MIRLDHTDLLRTLDQCAAEGGWSDAKQLHMLNVIYRDRLAECRAATERRLDLHRLLRDRAEGGQVIVVESGMDCDCVQYDGRVHGPIPATVQAFEQLQDEIAEWADGPFHLSIERPSERLAIHYVSSDRALEAYEDGHPFTVTRTHLDCRSAA